MNTSRSPFRPGGHGELWKISLPVTIMMGITTIQYTTDRLLLNWYSLETIPAVLPAGNLWFTLASPFVGMVGCVGMFVAQYDGAGEREKVGRCLWQALHLCFFAGLFSLLLFVFADKIFLHLNDIESVQKMETTYFRALCPGIVFLTANGAMSYYFSARGKTHVAMWVGLLVAAANALLAFVLIFGNAIVPRMGILGAGIATTSSFFLGTVVYALLVFTRKNEELHRVRSERGLRRDDMMRLLRYGVPAGISFLLSIISVNVMTAVVGTMAPKEQAAAGICIQIFLFFVPLLQGLGVGLLILVGKYTGMQRVDLVQRSIRTTTVSIIGCAAGVVLLFVLVPTLLLKVFGLDAARSLPNGGDVSHVVGIAVRLLQIYAVAVVFNALETVYRSALYGAGDTAFIMKANVAVLVLGLIVPLLVWSRWRQVDVYTLWAVNAVYGVALFVSFLVRYRSGRWMHASVAMAESGTQAGGAMTA